MTTAPLTPEQKRVLLAESMGYSPAHGYYRKWFRPNCAGNPKLQLPVTESSLPKFDDHNAAAQLRAALTEEEQERFVYFLRDITCGGLDEDAPESDVMWRLANATPEQTANAFARVRNLWP